MALRYILLISLVCFGAEAADKASGRANDEPKEQGRTLGPVLTGLAGAALGLFGDQDVLAAAAGYGGGLDPGLGLGALSSPYVYGNRYGNRYGNGIYGNPINNYGNRYGNGIYASPYPGNRYPNNVYQQSPLTQLLGLGGLNGGLNGGYNGGYNGLNNGGFNNGYGYNRPGVNSDALNQIATLLGQGLGYRLRPYFNGGGYSG